jgi:hypothetical protein
MSGVENLPRQLHFISKAISLRYEFVEKLPVLAQRQTFHVLKYKVLSIELSNKPQKIADECIPRIVQDPLADHGKALAGRAAEDDIDLPRSNSDGDPNFRAG